MFHDNSELYIKCLELAYRPVKGTDYNYDSLMAVAEDLFPENISRKEKLDKVLELIDKGKDGLFKYPQTPAGKYVEFTKLHMQPLREKTPPIEYVFELADKFYAAAINKRRLANSYISEANKKCASGLQDIQVGDVFVDAEWLPVGEDVDLCSLPRFEVILIGRTKVTLTCRSNISGAIVSESFLKSEISDKNKWIKLGYIDFPGIKVGDVVTHKDKDIKMTVRSVRWDNVDVDYFDESNHHHQETFPNYVLKLYNQSEGDERSVATEAQ